MWSLLPVSPLGRNGQKPSKQWLKACRSKRRRWWTPLQTPWTWRSAWPKSDTKWYEPFTLCFFLCATTLAGLKAFYSRFLTQAFFFAPWLFPCLHIDLTLPDLHLEHFCLFSTFPTSAVGGLAQDSISRRFQHPHVSCHKGLRPQDWMSPTQPFSSFSLAPGSEVNWDTTTYRPTH